MAQAKQLLLRRDPSDAGYEVMRRELIAARKANSLSQQSLADMIGRPQSFVAKVERGERSLDVVEFAVIARILNMDVVKTIASILSAVGE